MVFSLVIRHIFHKRSIYWNDVPSGHFDGENTIVLFYYNYKLPGGGGIPPGKIYFHIQEEL